MQRLRSFLRNKKGISSGEVIGLAITFFFVAILGPIAITQIANASSYNRTFFWDASVLTVFQVVLPIIWIIAVAIKYLPGKE